MNERSFTRIWERKGQFVAVFFLMFTVTYGFFYLVDFLPEAPASKEKNDMSTSVTAPTFALATEAELSVAVSPAPSATIAEPVLPTSIFIPALDKTVEVRNPSSRVITDLDAALLQGVVRHPDSATLDQVGNVFILGHSSYLPNVLNRNFQAFNGIQNLQWGDTIEVLAAAATYVYRVEKVYQAKASELVVPIADTGNRLTLATCNSFGSADDRYIVEATLQTVR